MRVTGHLFLPPPPFFFFLFFLDSICVMTTFSGTIFVLLSCRFVGEKLNCRHHCVCMCVSGIWVAQVLLFWGSKHSLKGFFVFLVESRDLCMLYFLYPCDQFVLKRGSYTCSVAGCLPIQTFNCPVSDYFLKPFTWGILFASVLVPQSKKLLVRWGCDSWYWRLGAYFERSTVANSCFCKNYLLQRCFGYYFLSVERTWETRSELKCITASLYINI